MVIRHVSLQIPTELDSDDSSWISGQLPVMGVQASPCPDTCGFCKQLIGNEVLNNSPNCYDAAGHMVGTTQDTWLSTQDTPRNTLQQSKGLRVRTLS